MATKKSIAPIKLNYKWKELGLKKHDDKYVLTYDLFWQEKFSKGHIISETIFLFSIHGLDKYYFVNLGLAKLGFDKHDLFKQGLVKHVLDMVLI